MTERTILVVGGTSGIGLAVAKSIVAHGESVVVTGRDRARADETASSIGTPASGLALDLSDPSGIAGQLAGLGKINGVILAATERDQNTVREYSIDRAMRMVTIKLVGYTEVVHTVLDRLEPSNASGIVLFGGRAKDAPYPGSTTVSTINGGVEALVRTLALELSPIRVNGIHPGVVEDTPMWAGQPAEARARFEARSPSNKLPVTADVVKTVGFLMGNQSMTGANINVDLGWRLT